jgi:D-beta-D-heptose 7-phosphate kinase/D-beta-D-heptose 1-phosphate adenosyltransferase
MNLERLLRPKNILVAGDVMLDLYSVGEVKRISPEAPVPVFKKLSERHALGGAANVAVNLISAGQRASLLTSVGSDANGDLLLEMLRAISAGSEMVHRSNSRRTTVKNRFFASNNQQVMRLDEEDSHALADGERAAMMRSLAANLRNFDVVILSDYLKGSLTRELAREIIGRSNEAGIRVLVDPKDTDLEKYAGAFLVKPNLRELCDLTGRAASTFDEIAEASAILCGRCGCEYALTTCGGRGMVLTDSAGRSEIFESTPVEVYDVTGAGDTVIAYLAACLANGFSVMDAVACANIAAGIQVSKVGTSPVYLSEVDAWNRKNDARSAAGSHKIIERSELPHLRATYRGKKMVFTNGCFDILHIGHADYLRKAAALGDVLIVGVNSDASTRRLKGNDRPVNGQFERASLIAALEFVDYVVIFDEDTPYELIREAQPDVLAKGADYRPEEVVGRDLVEAGGGTLALIPLVPGKSTTAIIKKLSKRGDDE